MIELIAPALIIGLILTAIAGPLGSFIVWGRMAYFGDTLAHSALLGVAFGLLFNIAPIVGVFAVTLLVGLLLALFQKQRHIGTDTFLGIMAHGALALALVLMSTLEGVRIDMMGLLFGDLLAADTTDILWVSGCAVLLGLLIWKLWNPLLNILINAELAQAEGIAVQPIRLLLMFALAILVAIGMKVVGALLITALLIIPPAAARPLSKTPEQMAFLASLIGMLSVIVGIGGSVIWDTPTGPSIVLGCCALFSISFLSSRFLAKG